MIYRDLPEEDRIRCEQEIILQKKAPSETMRVTYHTDKTGLILTDNISRDGEAVIIYAVEQSVRLRILVGPAVGLALYYYLVCVYKNIWYYSASG